MNKIKYFFVVLVIFLSCKTYKLEGVEKKNYHFWVNKNWTKSDKGHCGDLRYTPIKDKNNVQICFFQLKIKNIEYFKLEKYIKSKHRSFKQHFRKVKIILNKIDEKGDNYYESTTKWQSNFSYKMIKEKKIYYLKDDNLYTITYFGSVYYYDKYLKQADLIIKSFSLNE